MCKEYTDSLRVLGMMKLTYYCRHDAINKYVVRDIYVLSES